MISLQYIKDTDSNAFIEKSFNMNNVYVKSLYFAGVHHHLYLNGEFITKDEHPTASELDFLRYIKMYNEYTTCLSGDFVTFLFKEGWR
jgi:hypothetical protein